MISCLGLWTRTVAQYLLGWASILPTTWITGGGGAQVNRAQSGTQVNPVQSALVHHRVCINHILHKVIHQLCDRETKSWANYISKVVSWCQTTLKIYAVRVALLSKFEYEHLFCWAVMILWNVKKLIMDWLIVPVIFQAVDQRLLAQACEV